MALFYWWRQLLSAWLIGACGGALASGLLLLGFVPVLILHEQPLAELPQHLAAAAGWAYFDSAARLTAWLIAARIAYRREPRYAGTQITLLGWLAGLTIYCENVATVLPSLNQLTPYLLWLTIPVCWIGAWSAAPFALPLPEESSAPSD